MLTVLETGLTEENVYQQKGIRPCRIDFGANKSGPPKARTHKKNQFQKSVCITVLHVTYLDGEARLT
jgi:hypothetical protein